MRPSRAIAAHRLYTIPRFLSVTSLTLLLTGCGVPLIGSEILTAPDQQGDSYADAETEADILHSDTSDHDDSEVSDMLGEVMRKQLANIAWANSYADEYAGYEVDQSLLADLRMAMEGIEITIYFGTWCHDSRRQMPRLFNLMDELGIEHDRITLLALNRDKDVPGEAEFIHHTPTIIILDGDGELGRIIETPVESLEQDLLKIIRRQPYTPHHATLERN